MNDVQIDLAATLEQLAPREPVAPDWGAVVKRAGVRRRTLRVAAPIAIALLALLAAPAFGLHELLSGDARPGPHFTAQLQAVTGSGRGTFTARPVSNFVALNPGSGRIVGFSRRMAFTLRYRGLSGPVTVARLRVEPRGRFKPFVIRLCGPCPSGTTRILEPHRFLAVYLLSGRVTVEVATRAHPTGELRGQVRASR